LGDAKCVATEVRHAVELAQLHGAEVTAITLIDAKARHPADVVGTAGGSGRFRTFGASAWARELAHDHWEDLKAQTENSVKQLAEVCEEAGVIYRTESITGDPFATIAR
jgi:nucleotide-binding universal stress UspA family protein